MCNREMKFGVFLELAKAAGFTAVGDRALRAPASPGQTVPGKFSKASTRAKTNPIFWRCLEQHQIAAARFPVGDLHKTEVRKVASEFNLATAGKKDSQGICFIGEIKDARFSADFCPG